MADEGQVLGLDGSRKNKAGDGQYNEQILLSIIITRVSRIKTIADVALETQLINGMVLYICKLLIYLIRAEAESQETVVDILRDFRITAVIKCYFYFLQQPKAYPDRK